MSPSNPYYSELATSIEALFEGTLSDEEAARITRIVAEDPEAADLYWDYVELHSELRKIHRTNPNSFPDHSTILPTTTDTPSSSTPLVDHVEPPTPPGISGPTMGTLGMLAVIMATTMCVAVVALVGWIALRDVSSSPSRSAPIARITSISDSTSAGTHPMSRYLPGSLLAPGESVHLPTGTAEITYNNGVEVTLTGPATYRVIDDKFGLLLAGTARAKVPPPAIGFTINTPAGNIIDCGTEFDVSLDKDVQTGIVTANVRVIDGAVDINLSGEGADPKRFTAGEAALLSSLNHGSGQSDPNDVFDPRAIPGLRLWLNADAGVLRGPDDRVNEVVDLIGDSNTIAENVRQPSPENRPRWLSGTINNRPTLAFEGKQYIQLSSESDLNFSNESLSIFVVGNASGGTQYFLSSRAENEDKTSRGFRFTSSKNEGLRYQASGVTVIQPCDIRHHAVFCVIHDRRVQGNNTVTLFRNGHQLGPVVKVDDYDISNAFPLTIGANLEAIKKYPTAGQNYLRGELGEILIYDRVLNPEQRKEVELYLIRKYGFDRTAGENTGQQGNLPKQ